MTNEETFQKAWLTYLADANDYNWQQWDRLKQVMFAMEKTSDQVLALMDEAEKRQADE